jgi:hypothetical protein
MLTLVNLSLLSVLSLNVATRAYAGMPDKIYGTNLGSWSDFMFLTHIDYEDSLHM